MTWDGQYLSTSFVAAENLNTATHAGCAVVVTTGLLANNGKTASGILLPHSKPKSGEFGSAGYMGQMRFRAGATVAVGAYLTVTTSGYIITNPTSGYYAVGRCFEAAASGGLGVGLFNFALPTYFESSY
jgi:hypothetical protein